MNNIKLFGHYDHIPEISFENNELPEYITDFRIVDPTAAEASFEFDIDAGLLKSIIGIDLSHGTDMSCSMEIKSPRLVQRRRHKKKRINKKWAKRYGYKTVFDVATIRDCSLITHDNCEMEFIGTPEIYRT